jgi:hypothetical protein
MSFRPQSKTPYKEKKALYPWLVYYFSKINPQPQSKPVRIRLALVLSFRSKYCDAPSRAVGTMQQSAAAV